MEQNIIKLTEHFSYLQFGDNDRPNIGLVRGKNKFIVIDSGNSKKNAELFLQKTSLNGNHNGFLFLTHNHWDHICGSSYFDIPVFAGKEVYEKIEEFEKHKWNKNGILEARNKNYIPEFTMINMLNEQLLNDESDYTFNIHLPDFTVQGKLEINLGDINAIYLPITSCHCKGQYGIFIPKDKVFFIGDILWPNMDRVQSEWFYEVETFKKMRDELLSLNAEWYIESHAEPISRKKLEFWLERMILILDFVKNKKENVKSSIKNLPEHLKNVTLGYEDLIYEACDNCK